jgi:catechol 2,3-dioxygenase-like lactoylglutathione lyase family enzyme
VQPEFAHFSLRPADLDRTARFYSDTFGFEIGYRPPFEFEGRWLYLQDKPVLHLIGDRSQTATSEDFIDRKARASVDRGSGVLDHVALTLPESDLQSFIARLDSLGVGYTRRIVPLFGNSQVFVEDPDGIVIEILFQG